MSGAQSPQHWFEAVRGTAGEISDEWLAEVAESDPEDVRVALFNTKLVLLASAERDAATKEVLVSGVSLLIALAVAAGVVYVIVAARGG